MVAGSMRAQRLNTRSLRLDSAISDSAAIHRFPAGPSSRYHEKARSKTFSVLASMGSRAGAALSGDPTISFRLRFRNGGMFKGARGLL